MAELSRRGLFGTTAAGLAGLGIARAEAATLPSDQPAAPNAAHVRAAKSMPIETKRRAPTRSPMRPLMN